jgi:uncharacterized MAPEG superfamily protein
VIATMTTPLWCLLGFVVWTLLLLLALAVARGSLILSGAAKPTDFPAGIPHGSDAYWRLNRAHLNCLENLPLFATVVLTASVLGLRSATLDTLARVFLGARVGQSLTHIASGTALAINVRFTFFLVQVACLAGFLLTIARAG